MTNLADSLKIDGPCGVHGACFSKLKGPLALGGVRVPPSTKVRGEHDCRGKVKGRGPASQPPSSNSHSVVKGRAGRW